MSAEIRCYNYQTCSSVLFRRAHQGRCSSLSMGLLRRISGGSDEKLASHPDIAARIAMQSYVFSKRKPSQPLKRSWCELRGCSLFFYSSQGDRHPKLVYAMRSAEVEMLGLAPEDPSSRELELEPRFRLQLSLSPDSAEVTTPFDVQTDAEMRDWYHALVAAKRQSKQETDSFRVAAVSGKVRSIASAVPPQEVGEWCELNMCMCMCMRCTCVAPVLHLHCTCVALALRLCCARRWASCSPS